MAFVPSKLVHKHRMQDITSECKKIDCFASLTSQIDYFYFYGIKRCRRIKYHISHQNRLVISRCSIAVSKAPLPRHKLNYLEPTKNRVKVWNIETLVNLTDTQQRHLWPMQESAVLTLIFLPEPFLQITCSERMKSQSSAQGHPKYK